MTVATISAGGGRTTSVNVFEFSCGRGVSIDDPSLSNVHLRFQKLVRRWRKETSHWSLASRMAAHPAYREIISMGWAVVPLLLAELRRKPDHWFIALEEITGENPVLPECAGNVKKMADAWIQWGEQGGLAK
jgi:hypothetical protein